MSCGRGEAAWAHNDRVLIAGPPGLRAGVFSLIYHAKARGIKRFLLCAEGSKSFYHYIKHTFIALLKSFVRRCMGSKWGHVKTCANTIKNI